MSIDSAETQMIEIARAGHARTQLVERAFGDRAVAESVRLRDFRQCARGAGMLGPFDENHAASVEELVEP